MKKKIITWAKEPGSLKNRKKKMAESALAYEKRVAAERAEIARLEALKSLNETEKLHLAELRAERKARGRMYSRSMIAYFESWGLGYAAAAVLAALVGLMFLFAVIGAALGALLLGRSRY